MEASVSAAMPSRLASVLEVEVGIGVRGNAVVHGQLGDIGRQGVVVTDGLNEDGELDAALLGPLVSTTAGYGDDPAHTHLRQAGTRIDWFAFRAGCATNWNGSAMSAVSNSCSERTCCVGTS